MKFAKKLLPILALVAILATLFTSVAFAATPSATRVVRLADVTTLKVLDDQPATFRLAGTYTCDFVDIKATVSGKLITITASDVKVMYTGKPCGAIKNFRRDVNLGVLVPGIYKVVVNPVVNAKPQKVLTGFIAPILPPTPIPTLQP